DSDFKLDMTKTKQLTVTSEYSSGKTVDLSADDVTFESSNPEIATVNAAGLVTAVAGGSATITATLKSDETLQATTNVDVNAVKYKSLHLEVVEEDTYTTRDGSFHLSVTDENGNDVPWDEIKFLKDVQDSHIHISATGVVTADVPADEAKNAVIGVALKADETMVSNYRGMFFGPTETLVGIENYSTRPSGPHPDIYRFKDTYTSSDLSSLITPVESGDRVLLALSRPSYAPSIIDTRCSDVTSSNPDVVDVRLGEGGCILEYKSAGKAQVCGIMDGERRCVNIDT
ncbi:TPA: Ig-like domain-containing protein, partial [Photobacterium damselae]